MQNKIVIFSHNRPTYLELLLRNLNQIFIDKNYTNFFQSIDIYYSNRSSLPYKKKIIKSLNFKYAFGQHSGVMDETKDFYEFPRFPINEKYGEIKRFKSIINYFPLEYKNLEPQEKKLSKKNNPPKFKVEFFENQKNIENTKQYR